MDSDDEYRNIVATLENWGEEGFEGESAGASHDEVAEAGTGAIRVVWNDNLVKLMLSTRLAMESEFSKGEKSRATLWNAIQLKMKEKRPTLTLTVQELQRKFRNMLVTYNRIKTRNKRTGVNAVAWKYFNIFNEVYGSKHNVEPPENILFDSAVNTDDHERETTMMNEIRDGRNAPEDEPSSCSRVPRRKRTPKNIQAQLLEYWQKEDKEEKLRHEERMRAEAERNQIERDKNAIEKMKAECLQEMKEILLRMSATVTSSGTHI